MPVQDVQDNTRVKLLTPFEQSKAQMRGQGIPYSELFKAYTDILREDKSRDEEGKTRLEAFGEKSPLGQRMEIYANIDASETDPDKYLASNTLARAALKNMLSLPKDSSFRADAFPLAASDSLLKYRRQNLDSTATFGDPAFDLYGDKGFRNIVANTAEELNQSIADLKSMTKKDVNLQKLKEHQGTDFISDEDFYNKETPMLKGIIPYSVPGATELTPEGKYLNDLKRDKMIFTIPENKISKEDSTAAMDKLKAKQEYQEGFHPFYTGLKFTPLSPIAVAAENGEPISRGIAGAGASLAGTAGGIGASLYNPFVGAAIAGGANAFGDEIARGERPDELTFGEKLYSYGIPTAIGAGSGAILTKGGKVLKDKFYTNPKINKIDNDITTKNQTLNQAQEEANDIAERLFTAKEDLSNLNQNLWKGAPYNYNKAGKTAEEKAAEESTSKVMALIKQGKLNELDPDDIDNLILNPERAEDIANAMALHKEAFANEADRLALLQKLNSDPRFIKKVNQVLETEGVDPAYTEYGSDDLVDMARGKARENLNNTTDLNNEIKSLVDPDKAEKYYYNPAAQDIAASKLIYSEANLPKTADQVIFNKFGYDQWGKAPVMGTDLPFRASGLWDNGKGLLIKEVNASMPNADDAVKSKVINPFISQYVDHRTAPGISFGRGAQIQAQSYVEEAAEGILDKTIKDVDGLNRIFDEYKKWRLPANHTQADEDAIKREFVANIRIALNKPGAGYTYKDPSTMTTSELANRGKDILRAIRNPATTELHSSDPYGRLSFNQLRTMYDSKRSPSNFLDDIATMLDHNNISLRDGEIKGDPAFGWAGGFERPSKEAIGAFTGRKEKNRFRYTIEPKIKEALQTNATPTMEAVRAAGKNVDDLIALNKSKQAENKALKQNTEAFIKQANENKDKLRKISPKQLAITEAIFGGIPGYAGYRSMGGGLSRPEERTREEQLSKDKAKYLILNNTTKIPGIKYFYDPAFQEARKRGNMMPYRYLYIPTKPTNK